MPEALGEPNCLIWPDSQGVRPTGRHVFAIGILRSLARARYRIFRDLAIRRDPSDFVLESLREPDRTVGSGIQEAIGSICGWQWILAELAVRRQASNQIARRLSKP